MDSPNGNREVNDKQIWNLARLILDNDPVAVAKMIINSKKSTLSESVTALDRVRTEFGLLIVDIKNNINKMTDAFVKGQEWVCLKDYANCYWKGKKYKITKVTEKGAVVDGMMDLSRSTMLEYFERESKF